MKKVVLLLFINLFLMLPSNAEAQFSSADAMVLYNANEITEAQKVFNAIPDEQKTALDWLLLGNIFQDNNDTKNAVAMYKKAINTDKTFYRGYYNLGNLYLENENTVESIKLYKQAIKYKPDFGYAHYNLGCAYVKAGRLLNAKNSFLRAAQYKKDNADTYYNLAFVYKRMNKAKKAEESLKIYNELINRKL